MDLLICNSARITRMSPLGSREALDLGKANKFYVAVVPRQLLLVKSNSNNEFLSAYGSKVVAR